MQEELKSQPHVVALDVESLARENQVPKSANVILLGAAMVGGGPLCIILGVLFLISAYTTWQKEKDEKGKK